MCDIIPLLPDYRSDQYEVKAGENELYMPGEDLALPAKAVARNTAAVMIVWFNPKEIDTIQLSASAKCTSGASDAFQKNLLVKVTLF